MKHHTIEDGAVPYHYSLWFEPDLTTFRFRGKASIKLRLSREMRSLRLNAKELELKEARVRCGGSEQQASVRLEGAGEAVFGFKEPVRGEIELTVEYEGAHNDRLYGFYRARVSEGEYMLSSQFETANARAAFPCLDEPHFKATFDVTILLDEGLEAVSNMPVKSVTERDGRKEWAFETTPVMSTYLLYLGVGRFDRLESGTKPKLSVLATKGKKEYMGLALDYGSRLLADLESYFRIGYPLPKLDLLAIPDFAAGAMENWGAIAFRETALLGSEQRSTVVGKQRIAEVVGHELAHMWFGDLVTMEWWDDMWLNKSFATYMEYKAVDRQFPQWKVMLKYYLDSVGLAFAADGVKNTHPISVKVDTVGEVEELFDAIGYNKGGSVLLMLENFVGSDVFRDGLTRYIKKHSYANATRNDLWAAIEDECREKGKDLPVIEVMDDWVTREGYPVVRVKEKKEGVFELSQERFTISGNMPGTWKIPLSYLSDKGEGRMLMDGESATIEAGWLKLNHRQAGFYRVAYEPKNLAVLGRMIKEKKLGEVDAWGVENDLFAFVRSGMLPLQEYLGFVREHCMDCGYPADVNISGHLAWLDSIAYREPFAKEAAELSRSYHGKLLERLGWDMKPGESSSDTRLRSLSISELGMLGDEATVKKCESLFGDGRGIDPNIRAAVYSTVMFNKPDGARFDGLLAAYKGDGAPEEKIIALQALGMAGERKLMDRALELSLSGEVRLQDSYILTSRVGGSNPLGRLVYRDWARGRWKDFLSRYDPASHMLKGCVQSFGMLADRKSQAELEEFFNDQKNMRDDIKVAVRQTVERIAANVRFVERNSG